MQVVRAIQTRYGGCKFRSRVEARWAVFFDAVEEPWEYEREGYELPSGPYLPDFWLPRAGLWVEIKGADATGQERTLCEELAEGTDAPVVLISGTPVTHKMELRESGVWVPGVFWAFGNSVSGRHLHPVRTGSTDLLLSVVSTALISARSARFEHGELG